MNHKLIYLLLFLFILPIVNASTFVPTKTDFMDWISIGFIIVTIHILIVSLAYMYANFFMAEDLKGWSKNEIMQAVYSIFILAFFVGIFVFLNSIAGYYFADILSSSNVGASEPTLKTFCFDSGSNRWSDSSSCSGLTVKVENNNVVCSGEGSENCNPMFLMARSYLGISYEKLASLHKKLFRNYALMSAMNSGGFSLWVGQSSGEFGGQLGMGFVKDGIYINLVESLILFVEKILLALKFQESILKFMEYGLAFYLIILGLIFRSIFIFRKFGGLLLSLGMCFMFVLPLLYILGWYTLSIPNIEVVFEDNFDGGTVSIAENWIFWTSIVSTLIFATHRVLEFFSLKDSFNAIIKTVIDPFVIIGQVVMFVEYGLYVNANSPDFYFTDYKLENKMNMVQEMGVLDYISRFLIIALALPLLNIYIFFAFVRGLSPLLGGDAEIPGLGRFL